MEHKIDIVFKTFLRLDTLFYWLVTQQDSLKMFLFIDYSWVLCFTWKFFLIRILVIFVHCTRRTFLYRPNWCRILIGFVTDSTEFTKELFLIKQLVNVLLLIVILLNLNRNPIILTTHGKVGFFTHSFVTFDKFQFWILVSATKCKPLVMTVVQPF